MKFKVGDKVRVRKDLKYNSFYGGVRVNDEMVNNKGKILTIIGIDGRTYLMEGSTWFWTDEMFENKEYTYEDLKKTPIGTKIKFENGETLLKDGAGLFESDGYIRTIEELKKFETRLLGKIVKIEEPKYKTVYEYKPEILDETEKRYLRGVIRPFRNKVKHIKKYDFLDTENIEIGIEKDNYIWKLSLPPFKKDTMYKGMKLDKRYTLDELGL